MVEPLRILILEDDPADTELIQFRRGPGITYCGVGNGETGEDVFSIFMHQDLVNDGEN